MQERRAAAASSACQSLRVSPYSGYCSQGFANRSILHEEDQPTTAKVQNGLRCSFVFSRVLFGIKQPALKHECPSEYSLYLKISGVLQQFALQLFRSLPFSVSLRNSGAFSEQLLGSHLTTQAMRKRNSHSDFFSNQK